MSVTAIPNGLSRPRERWSMRKAIYYRETATLVHDSGAARGDDAMASMTNLRILYMMYIFFLFFFDHKQYNTVQYSVIQYNPIKQN